MSIPDEGSEKGDGVKNLRRDRKVGERYGEMKTMHEQLKTRAYRDMYSNLLHKHKGLLDIARSGDKDNGEKAGEIDEEDYREEQSVIRQIIWSEQLSILSGVAAGIGTMVALRMAPRLYGRFFSKSDRYKKIVQAERDAEQVGTVTLQRAIKLILEGTFSIWAGWSVYRMVSHQSQDTYTAIAEIPLCRGKSKVAETICPEWVDITKNRIPPLFWESMDKPDGIADRHTWQAVRNFSDNCVRRQRFEEQIKRQQKWEEDADMIRPIPLPIRVPVNEAESISKEQVEKFTLDS